MLHEKTQGLPSAGPAFFYCGISSGFGSRWGRNHNGLDIISSNGTVLGKPIVAADSGTVILSKYYSGYGNCIMIDHGNGYVTLYGHLSSISVSVGQTVSQGATIGAVGSTGNSTGPHLHFEVLKNGTRIDPEQFFSGLTISADAGV